MLKNLIEVQKPPTDSAIGVRGIYDSDDADFEEPTGRGAGAVQEEDITMPESTISGSVKRQLDGTNATTSTQAAYSKSLQLIVITHDRRLVFFF